MNIQVCVHTYRFFKIPAAGGRSFFDVSDTTVQTGVVHQTPNGVVCQAPNGVMIEEKTWVRKKTQVMGKLVTQMELSISVTI